MCVYICSSLSLYIYIYHHHHVAPPARISLTVSRHFSLSFIASGRSSGLQPVSSQVARSCNLATWRLVRVDGLRMGSLVCAPLWRSGVRTKPGINMVGSRELKLTRLTEEGRLGLSLSIYIYIYKEEQIHI